MKRVAVAAAALAVLLLLWFLSTGGMDHGGATAPASTETDEALALPSVGTSAAEPLVAAAAEDAQPAVAPPPAVRREAQILDGELALDEDGTGITGRVLDADGRPVAGARLIMIEDSWGIEGEYWQSEQSRDLSDQEGRFRLWRKSWSEVGSLRVFVSAEGWPTWFGRVALLGEGSDVVLGHSGSLPLHIVFEDGSPVADATVYWENIGFELTGSHDVGAVAATLVGRTDLDGRLLLPVFESRRDLSIVVTHPLHSGRHAAPIAAWRGSEDLFEWTLRVPRGAAFQVRLTDWPGSFVEVPGQWSGIGLTLAPYERASDGSLTLREWGPWGPDPAARGAAIAGGTATVGRLDAPAYRISLAGYCTAKVLVDPWVPTPGLTTWSCPTPERLPVQEGLTVELVVPGLDADPTVWQAWPFVLVMEDAAGRREQHRLSEPGEVRFSIGLQAPVTLRLPDLGAAGLRTDVPATGRYRFEIAAADVLAATGGLRVDFSGLERPPRSAEAHLAFYPEAGGEQRSVDPGVEAHGIPAGRWKVLVVAAGVEQAWHHVIIEPGRTTIVAARPAPPPKTGLVRGRVNIRGDGDWLRLHMATFTDATGNTTRADDVARFSFAARLEPGHYRGRATLGQLVDVDARDHDPDLTRHDFPVTDELPSGVDFECDVVAGQSTNLVLDVEAGELCRLRLLLPSGLPPFETPDWWYVQVFPEGGTKAAVVSAVVDVWPAEGVLARVGAGRFRVVAERTADPPAGRRTQQLEASVEVRDGERDSTLELALSAAPAEPR